MERVRIHFHSVNSVCDGPSTTFRCLVVFLGEVIHEKDRCKECEGRKVSKEVKVLEVHVDKGMKHGQKITFSGEADQSPNTEPGDIILVLQEKDHEVTHTHSVESIVGL